jgi:hypothetical protein
MSIFGFDKTRIAGASGSSGWVGADLLAAGTRTNGRGGGSSRVASAGWRTSCSTAAPELRFAASRRRMRLMYEVRLVTLSAMPASSASHLHMLFTLCPTARAASMSGQSARIWPAFVAAFPRGAARGGCAPESSSWPDCPHHVRRAKKPPLSTKGRRKDHRNAANDKFLRR